MNDTEESKQFLDSTRFWFQRVLVPLLVCIGIGGNTVTVVVLTRKRMRCSTNIYLTALAVADIIYLVCVFVLSFSHYNHIHDIKYELYWRFYGLIHWLCDSASNTSVWLTVSFTLERYIAVCHPIKGKVLCTESRAKTIITAVAIFCVLATLSTAFEYELIISEACETNCTTEQLQIMRQMSGKCPQNLTFHHLPDHNMLVSATKRDDDDDEKLISELYTNIKPIVHKLLPENCTSHHPHIIYLPVHRQIHNASRLTGGRPDDKSETSEVNNATSDAAVGNQTCCTAGFKVKPGPTNLAKNRTYAEFMTWFCALCYSLVPLVLITACNCLLVHAVYRSQSRRRKMTNSQENVKLTNENRITVMLIGVVFLFLICQTPTAIFLIYTNFYETQDVASENIRLALGNIFNFLMTLNAATNFVVYCILSKKYRMTFNRLFCGRRQNRQDTLLLSTRTRISSVNNGLRRNASEYQTPRHLETQSLTSIPRSKSLMTRPPGKARSSDINV